MKRCVESEINLMKIELVENVRDDLVWRLMRESEKMDRLGKCLAESVVDFYGNIGDFFLDL